MIVDPWSRCNLSCPLCLTGAGKSIKRSNLISLETYARVIEPLKDHLFFVGLYNWGEPFFNPDLYSMVEWNQANNIGSIISSNLNLDIDADRLVKTGLDFLIISGDGISQEVYEKYRVNGKLDKVLANLRSIAEAKRRHGSKKPFIEWQCLVNRYNENDLEKIKKTVYGIGADLVRFGSLNFWGLPDQEKEKWLPDNPNYRMFETTTKPGTRRNPCYWLWRAMVVNSDFSVSPCCLYDIKGWADISKESFNSVWQGKKYRDARGLSRNSGQDRKKGLICSQCEAPWIIRQDEV
ncbi:MAG: radical SAM/SPASM domain-containing protein [Candidatus Rifleibacteriota bacterium]